MNSLFEDDEPKFKTNPVVSGSFTIKGEDLISDIRLELNAKHPKYNEYHKKLSDLLSEARKIPDLLKYSSGI